MATLAFILIAHEPAGIVGQSIDMLLRSDANCTLVVHYDRNSPSSEFAELKRRYGAHDRILLVEDRARCGWGQFGLVDGTIRALSLLAVSGKAYTHAYLISCSCWPIRPLAELRQFLDRHGEFDFIENHDEGWMTGGLREERYTLRHPFGFARRRRLFEASVHLQRKLGLKRKIPAGLKPRYGSQWWCLRQETIAGILTWVDENPAAYRFYRQVWIPDETFFQTVVHALDRATAPGGYIPTLYTFNRHGKPIVFFDDHLAWLQEQPYFFARKVALSAKYGRSVLEARAGLPSATDKPILDVPKPGERPLPGTRESKPQYGQLFEPNSAVRNWAMNLETLDQVSVVLYGPPQLTGLAGQILGAEDGLTVLGRLFHADKVEFEPGRSAFSGLQSDDTPLRDYDRALYLSRVLSRCAHLPVFELCPGDDPVLEKLALESERPFIVLPLVPGGRLPAWRPLFWYLALPEPLRAEIDLDPERSSRLQRAQDIAIRHFGRKNVAIIDKRLFGFAAMAGGIVFSGAGRPIDPEWRASLGFAHGMRVDPLMKALDVLAEAFANRDWRQLAPALAEQVEGTVAGHG
ncbi:hypothetical protein J2Y63_006463 [Shinella sp. BE166]|uniref:beta-1,6-N-acetylglucosaminyltransferase n=1 Tax=Shinella sp. BE166 TaxID=3373918 RepID=UPI003EBA8160